MKITQIEIQNYRSIKDVVLHPTDLMALVGPNNAGKTNILSALNFVLGDRWPSANSLEPTDRFNKERHRNIRIIIHFARENNDANISHIGVTEHEGRFSAQFKTFGNDQRQYLNDAIRSQFPIVYLDAARNFDNQFSMSRWSLFGRIARQLHDDFDRTAPVEVKQALTTHLLDAQNILKTPLYRTFEDAITASFQQQIRHAMQNVRLDFRSFDPLNFYKAIYPTLIDGAIEKSPAEAGSGVRNLIVLALFKAYAAAFRNSTVFAVEEPEIYLHPHAQRSLAKLYREMAEAGHQVFFSTHSAAFIDVSRSDQIVLVERCEDGEEEICTNVRTVEETQLLQARQRLHPNIRMSTESVRGRYRNICGIKHAEAFFAKAILLCEGATEEEVFPIFAQHLGMDLDGLGVSVVGAEGKNNLDSLWQLYSEHQIPVYLTFDNDRNGTDQDRAPNGVLTRMLGLAENLLPDGVVTGHYAIIEVDIETTIRREVEAIQPGLYDRLKAEAREIVGQGKPLVARYISTSLAAQDIVPPTIRAIIDHLSRLVKPEQAEVENDVAQPDNAFS